MIYGYTGTSVGMTSRQMARVWRLFEEHDLTVLHHGDCVGGDAQAHTLARDFKATVIGHPPLNTVKRAFCHCDELREPLEYLARNRQLVAEARDGVIAAPRELVKPANLRGHGTWTTIGYAREANCRLWIVYPDGTFIEEYEPPTLFNL